MSSVPPQYEEVFSGSTIYQGVKPPPYEPPHDEPNTSLLADTARYLGIRTSELGKNQQSQNLFTETMHTPGLKERVEIHHYYYGRQSSFLDFLFWSKPSQNITQVHVHNESRTNETEEARDARKKEEQEKRNRNHAIISAIFMGVTALLGGYAYSSYTIMKTNLQQSQAFLTSWCLEADRENTFNYALPNQSQKYDTSALEQDESFEVHDVSFDEKGINLDQKIHNTMSTLFSYDRERFAFAQKVLYTLGTIFAAATTVFLASLYNVAALKTAGVAVGVLATCYLLLHLTQSYKYQLTSQVNGCTKTLEDLMLSLPKEMNAFVSDKDGVNFRFDDASHFWNAPSAPPPPYDEL